MRRASLIFLLLSASCLGQVGGEDDDAGSTPDAGPADASVSSDASVPGDDAGAREDAGLDAGEPDDAGQVDAGGSDAGPACPASAPADLDEPSLAACSTLLYVAGGDDTMLITSTDGVTWTTSRIANVTGDDFINSIDVSRGVVTTTALPGVFQSLDGGANFELVTGVAHNGFNTYGGQLTNGPQGLLLTDNEGTYLAADGVTWVRQKPFPDGGAPDGFGGHHRGTAYGNDRYVVLQDNARVRTLHGADWYAGSLPVDVASLAFGAGRFVAVGSSGTLTSVDGETWTPQTFPDGGVMNANVVLFDAVRFYAYSGASVFTSTDGQTWAPTPLSPGVRIRAAAVFEGHFFAVGTSNNVSTLLRSSDGANWTVAYTPTTDETFRINGPRVAMGRVLRSP